MNNTTTAATFGGLNLEELQTVESYALENGRNWKSALRDDWFHARQPGILQSIRNDLGPEWLVKFNLKKSLAASKATGGAQ